MMTKKDFIALADAIRDYNRRSPCVGIAHDVRFLSPHLDALAAFCLSCNPRFDRGRWLSYIRGECGSNGGAIREPKSGTT